MRVTIILAMVRRTVTIPDSLDERVRAQQREGESFSAAVARLLEEGLDERSLPSYVASAPGGTDDSIRIEEIMGEVFDQLEAWERGR